MIVPQKPLLPDSRRRIACQSILILHVKYNPRAIARKIAFRIAVPRNELITHRLPWSRTRRG